MAIKAVSQTIASALSDNLITQGEAQSISKAAGKRLSTEERDMIQRVLNRSARFDDSARSVLQDALKKPSENGHIAKSAAIGAVAVGAPTAVFGILITGATSGIAIGVALEMAAVGAVVGAGVGAAIGFATKD